MTHVHNKEFRETDIRQPILLASELYEYPTCVEVGVNEGVHAEAMLFILNPIKLYLIDPWYGNQRPMVKEKFKDYDHVHLIQEYSDRASILFANHTLDLVYIDADHEYEAVKLDLNFWYLKMKHGGMLCGHDANREGVEKAINEFKDENNIELNISDNCRNFWFIT